MKDIKYFDPGPPNYNHVLGYKDCAAMHGRITLNSDYTVTTAQQRNPFENI